jgi:hypothetical protein
MLDDRRDPGVERQDQDQQQYERHRGNGKQAPSPEQRLQAQERRPGRDDQRRAPDESRDEWPQDPEAAGDQAADQQQLEERACEVGRAIGAHRFRPELRPRLTSPL